MTTENTYLDKNIVFNIEGSSGAEVIVDNSSPTSSTKLVIDPEITSVEVLTKDDIDWHKELSLSADSSTTQQYQMIDFWYKPKEKNARVNAQLVGKSGAWTLSNGSSAIVQVPNDFKPKHVVPISIYLSNQNVSVNGGFIN